MEFRQCPKCAALGKDTRRNNLCIYDDGHNHCFGCGYHTRAPDSIANMKKRGGNAQNRTSFLFDKEDFSYSIPADALAWLRKYGITDAEVHKHNICWDEEKQSLIFPIFDNERLVSYTGRYFGTDKDHPRYITAGDKKAHYKLFAQEESDVYVLVEDYVSAIKVGRHFNCIPLLGAHVSLSLIISLVRYQPILRVWLDRDKASQAITFSNRARQYIKDCATIVTDLDPKDYNDGAIKSHVLGTLKSISQLRDVQ